VAARDLPRRLRRRPAPGGIWWIDAAPARRRLIIWILAWGAHASAPRRALLDRPLYPATARDHGHLPASVLPALRLVTGHPVAAHRATLLATFAAAFYDGGPRARVGGSWIAGAAASVLYAFSPFGPLPAGAAHGIGVAAAARVLAAERVASGAAARWTFAFGAALAAQALSSYYLAYASAVATAVLLGAAIVDARARPYAWRLAAATVAALGVVVACSVPYLRAHAGGALAAADPQYVAAVSATPGRTGATLAVLLAMATAPWWRAADVRPLWLVALALAGVLAHLLALGPVIQLGGLALPGPYALVQALVPGFGLVRGPERLNVVTTAAAAALAGIGVAGVTAVWRSGRRASGAALAAALVVTLAAVPATMRWPVPRRGCRRRCRPSIVSSRAAPVSASTAWRLQSARRGLAVEARRAPRYRALAASSAATAGTRRRRIDRERARRCAARRALGLWCRRPASAGSCCIATSSIARRAVAGARRARRAMAVLGPDVVSTRAWGRARLMAASAGHRRDDVARHAGRAGRGGGPARRADVR
jgi:hypothetical protein